MFANIFPVFDISLCLLFLFGGDYSKFVPKHIQSLGNTIHLISDDGLTFSWG